MNNNHPEKGKKTFKLWLQVLLLKIRATRFTHIWIKEWETGGILIKNYWSHWYPGFPFLLAEGNFDDIFKHWQFRIGFLGFVLVIFNEGKRSQEVSK
ncbi:hypothetical protein [Leptospira ainazelensis]|uniref:hypothetical protein n=1 Tax=Leptospira ainazelensis TaxID=2810034 RepID=UPI0019622EE0|nr:hypothetical protein [Leptospira ainazelensis]